MGSLIIFILSAVLGGLLGGYFSKKGGDLVSMQPAVESETIRPKNASNPNGEPKTTENNQPINKQE